MGRAGRGGGMRGGGGRMGGGLGGRTGGGSLGGSLGGGRAGRGMGAPGRAPVRAPAPRVAPRVAPRGRAGSFGAGMATGMMMGGMRRRMWGPRWGWGGGWGWGRRRRMMMGGPMMHGGGGGGGCGCFTVILGVFVLIIAIALIGQIFNLGTGGGFRRVDVPQSTIERTALSRNAANTPNPRFVDNLGWIENSTRLINGMNNFHNETGVMPFVYITDNLNGIRRPTMADMERYAQSLFTYGVANWNFNEANLLVLVFEYDGGYGHYILAGNQAGIATLIDAQAVDILSGFINYYWYADIDACELFNRAFTRAGSRIMTVHRSPWINVLIVAIVLLILFLLFTWWKAKRDQKNLEAEQTERILNQDLSEFGAEQDEAGRLAQQYEDDNQN